MSWWAPTVEDELAQGDRVANVVFSVLVTPLTPLVKDSVKGQPAWSPRNAWTPDANGKCHALASGRMGTALVLTHSCELDKARSKGRVIVAPVQALTVLAPD